MGLEYKRVPKAKNVLFIHSTTQSIDENRAEWRGEKLEVHEYLF